MEAAQNHPSPTSADRSMRVESNEPSMTRRLGVAIGRLSAPHSVIALNGELGAGKTTLVQGIAAGMGIHARVTSPTFTLVNEYATPDGARRLLHADSYRLGDDATSAAFEAVAMGLEEMLYDDDDVVIVIEWAERLAPLLPADRLEIRLHHVSERARQIDLHAYGLQAAALLAALDVAALSAENDLTE